MLMLEGGQVLRTELSLSAAVGHIHVRTHQTVTLIEANPSAYVEPERSASGAVRLAFSKRSN